MGSKYKSLFGGLNARINLSRISAKVVGRSDKLKYQRRAILQGKHSKIAELLFGGPLVVGRYFFKTKQPVD